MTDYKNFNAEDFIQDDFFISWVMHPTRIENDFWNKWLLDFPEKKSVIIQARTVLLALEARPIDHPVTDSDVEDILTYIREHTSGHVLHQKDFSVLMYRKWLNYAAVLFAVLTMGTLIYWNVYKDQTVEPKRASSQWITYKNGPGQSKIIRMPDHSVAVLKPNSAIKFLSMFSGGTRDVYLSGEAFFEVRKNADKAFLVHSQGMVTKVLGTSFTVRAFEKENDFSVIVNTGKVVVYNGSAAINAKSPSILLIPRQQVTLHRQEKVLVRDTIVTTMMLEKETAKKEFSFDKAAIPTVIQKLENAYNVKITYDERQFENVTVTAALSDLPLDEKVKMICKAVDAVHRYVDGQITIEKK